MHAPIGPDDLRRFCPHRRAPRSHALLVLCAVAWLAALSGLGALSLGTGQDLPSLGLPAP